MLLLQMMMKNYQFSPPCQFWGRCLSTSVPHRGGALLSTRLMSKIFTNKLGLSCARYLRYTGTNKLVLSCPPYLRYSGTKKLGLSCSPYLQLYQYTHPTHHLLS